MIVLYDLLCENETVTPDINAKIESKNVFCQDGRWTCYRRNYLGVSVDYGLAGSKPGKPLYVKLHKDRVAQVQALGVTLSASQDKPVGKPIPLVKHTPKRDRGPVNPVGIEKLQPKAPGQNGVRVNDAPGPSLPLQDHDSLNSPPLGQYTFERIQFKSATANNGRRRAAQQFYHLLVELHADIRKNRDGNPQWVKIAHRVSDPMIVRGRSPGHYKVNTRDPGHPGAAGGNMGGKSVFPYSFTGGHASQGYGFGLASSGGGGTSGVSSRLVPGTFANRSSISSGSSLEGFNLGPLESHSSDATMTDEEAYEFQNAEGYRYYPHALYDTNALQTQLRPAPPTKLETYTPAATPSGVSNACSRQDMNYKRNTAATGSIFHTPPYNRFQGMETSRGHYPGVNTGYTTPFP